MDVTIPNVFANVHVEEGWLLRNYADCFSEALLRNITYILSIDQDATMCDVVEAV